MNRRKRSFVSVKFANVCAILLLGIVALFLVLIVAGWKIEWTKMYVIDEILRIKTFVMYCLLIISIPIHEWIHAITFYCFVKDRTVIKVGFDKSNLAPYCYCSKKVRLWQYIIVIAMPLIILGILPCMLAVFCKDLIFLIGAAIEISCAGADLVVILIAIFHGNYQKYVIDHPNQVGFLVVEED